MEKAYERYKRTSNKWYPEIPRDWKICKLKHVANTYAGGTPSTVKNEFWENGNIPWLPSGKLKNSIIDTAEKFVTELGLNNSSTKMIKPNTVLVALTGATCANIGYLTFEACANQSVVAIDENIHKANSKFLFYSMLHMREQILTHQTGGAQSGVNDGNIKNLFLTVPSKQEQTQIAAYLDYHTQLIDTLISKKETLIQKLQEQRQAIINEAVTKGLNKNVALKDSGIEWLGDIPEHWEVVKLKFLGESITGITYSPNDVFEKGTLVLRSSNIQNGKLDLQDTVYVNKKISDKYISQKGDILLCSRNGSRNLIGKNIILDEQVENETWGAFMTVYRSIYNDFIYYFFNSDIFSALSSLFLSSTINQLTIGVLNNMQIAFPKEQKEREQIVHYLKQETEEVNSTIDKIQTSIQKLKDYRQSLISEAVTGKIDVRDWQQPNK